MPQWGGEGGESSGHRQDSALTAGLGGSQGAARGSKRTVAKRGTLASRVWCRLSCRQKLAQTEDLSLALLGGDGVLLTLASAGISAFLPLASKVCVSTCVHGCRL